MPSIHRYAEIRISRELAERNSRIELISGCGYYLLLAVMGAVIHTFRLGAGCIRAFKLTWVLQEISYTVSASHTYTKAPLHARMEN